LWKLFMAVPEVQAGLRRLGFKSPHLKASRRGPRRWNNGSIASTGMPRSR
jgi:hypothetical protein